MRNVLVDGRSFNVVDSGPTAGTAIVFVNALGTDSRVWDGVVAALPSHLHLVRMDKRGHGLSEETSACSIEEHAGDLAGVLDRLGVHKALVVGLSIGGLIAELLAVTRPDLVRGLVLLDTAHRIGTPQAWNDRIAAVRSGGLAAIADAAMARWFSDRFRQDEPGVVAAWRMLLQRAPVDGYLAGCEAVRDADLSSLAAGLSVPTLYAVGSEDISTTPDAVRAAAALVPGAGFALIDGAGHLVPVERPAAVADLIRTHLEAAGMHGSSPDPLEAGEATRRRILGDAHVDRANAATTPFDAPFQDFITRTAWASLWSRPDFTPRERSIVTIALLAALGHHEELALHLVATRNTGASSSDIREALLHVAVYAGVPAANAAFRIAKPVLAEARLMDGGEP